MSTVSTEITWYDCLKLCMILSKRGKLTDYTLLVYSVDEFAELPITIAS